MGLVASHALEDVVSKRPELEEVELAASRDPPLAVEPRPAIARRSSMSRPIAANTIANTGESSTASASDSVLSRIHFGRGSS